MIQERIQVMLLVGIVDRVLIVLMQVLDLLDLRDLLVLQTM